MRCPDDIDVLLTLNPEPGKEDVLETGIGTWFVLGGADSGGFAGLTLIREDEYFFWTGIGTWFVLGGTEDGSGADDESDADCP